MHKLTKTTMTAKHKVLLVDADLVTQKLVAETLAARRGEAKCLRSSQEAVTVIEREKFDGIIITRLLSGIDGLELVRRIRRSKSNYRTPVIFVSDSTPPRFLGESFAAGVNLFLTKPVTSAKLSRALNAVQHLMLEERRDYQRASMAIPIACRHGKQRAAGTSVNLSARGMLLKLPQPFPRGCDVAVSFTLHGMRDEFEVNGQVVRIGTAQEVGIKFTRLSPAQRRSLVDFIEQALETISGPLAR